MMTRKTAALIAGFAFAIFVLIASWSIFSASPARAQFADQASYATAVGGTANAQTITLPNATTYTDLIGVLVKYVPTVANTGAATLTVNGFGSSPSFRKPSGTGVTALIGGEIQIGQPVFIMYDGTFFNLMAPVTLPINAAALANSALSFGMPVNLGLSATVSANALTVALKGLDGTDPSPTNPVLVPFRNATIATGTPSIISQQTTLSITVSSTNTMGCVSGLMCRLWVVVFNNSGTAAIALFNARSGTSIAPINEAALQTSASGTTGGSSAQTYYASTSAITAKAIRKVGYIDIQEVTAGTWATGPTYIQLFGPGIRSPGDVMQTLYNSNGAADSTTNTYTISNTAPVPANGKAAVAAPAVTAQSLANVIRVSAQAVIANSGGSTTVLAFINDGTTTVATAPALVAVLNSGLTIPVKYQSVPTALTPITYTLYFAGVGGTTFLNEFAGSTPLFNATGSTNILVEEIMGALPEPANDNGEMRMVG